MMAGKSRGGIPGPRLHLPIGSLILRYSLAPYVFSASRSVTD
jgi:hypothetical protein